MARLDEIVAQMEEEQLPLEDMVQVYEEGVRLLKLCRGRIEGARARVERINTSMESEDDTTLTPFDPADEESGPADDQPKKTGRRSRAATKSDDDAGDEIRLF